MGRSLHTEDSCSEDEEPLGRDIEVSHLPPADYDKVPTSPSVQSSEHDFTNVKATDTAGSGAGAYTTGASGATEGTSRPKIKSRTGDAAQKTHQPPTAASLAHSATAATVNSINSSSSSSSCESLNGFGTHKTQTSARKTGNTKNTPPTSTPPDSPNGDTSSEEECIDGEESSSGHGDGESMCDSSEGTTEEGSDEEGSDSYSEESSDEESSEESSEDKRSDSSQRPPPKEYAAERRAQRKKRAAMSDTDWSSDDEPRHNKKAKAKSKAAERSNTTTTTGTAPQHKPPESETTEGEDNSATTEKTKPSRHGRRRSAPVNSVATEIALEAAERAREWARTHDWRVREIDRAAARVGGATTMHGAMSALVAIVDGICNAADDLVREGGRGEAVLVPRRTLARFSYQCKAAIDLLQEGAGKALECLDD